MRTVTTNLRVWGSDIDGGTINQALKASRLPILAGPVALMPDAHVGIGATVGSVIATERAVIPSAVGVDLGCGMIAAELDLTANQLPDDLGPLLDRISQVIPAGVGQGHGDHGYGTSAGAKWLRYNPAKTELSERQHKAAVTQFGSLGSGNHFFEVCLDERDRVWIVLHSGSRGIGNQLAQAHIAEARGLEALLTERLEDRDLMWLTEGTPEFSAYVDDMLWAQDYARANRDQMMTAALAAFWEFIGHGRETFRVNCHHNFCQQEQHAGRNVWITRKGAIRADAGRFGVIPGSMGTRSYIVRGLGNPDSWDSCSHGAGRRHSRAAAKRMFTVDDLAAQMGGKTWQADKAEALLDEIPSAYKNIDQVMADQADLVEVMHTLRQILNYKGT